MSLPPYNQQFTIIFENGNQAKAVRIAADGDCALATKELGFTDTHPVIFISGGASKMSDEDKRLTTNILQEVAKFAEEHGAIIIDGGTESGIMQMIGDVRDPTLHKFSLIGISPLGKDFLSWLQESR